MKIAVPTRNDIVDEHFGHCEYYTIFTINEDKSIASSEVLPAPQGCGCKSNITEILQQKGVTMLLAGNMGTGALNVLNRFGISVIRGCSGDINDVVEAYLKGEIVDSQESCSHHDNHGEGHDNGHQCNHYKK